MCTTYKAKWGRWVYEGGGLEQNAKSPRGSLTTYRGCVRVFIHYSDHVDCRESLSQTAFM